MRNDVRTNDEGQPQYLNDKPGQYKSGERSGLEQYERCQHNQPAGRQKEKPAESHKNPDYYNNPAIFSGRDLTRSAWVRLTFDTTTKE
jgi:hypothetical protein